MAHFCGFIKLIFLLLMLAQIPTREMKPLKSAAVSNSDLIAGNAFLKLFLERDQLQASDSSGGSATFQFEQGDDLSEHRSLNSRSLRDQGSNGHQALIPTHQQKDEGNNNKQVVKLVTTGSKIVFLEDYDNDDAIIDAEARDIDLQKEDPIDRKKKNITTNLDDFKVVAVSVSTSSHREKSQVAKIQGKLNHNIAIATNKVRAITTTKKPPIANTITSQSKVVDLTANDNFINRSHKSELSIEEVEPYSKVQRIRRPIRIIKHHKPVSGLEGKLNGMDAQHSASTNLKRIVVIPRSANKRFSHTNARNITTSDRDTLRNGTFNSQLAKMPEEVNGAVGDDQLLPFETVIYHDTKEGNGPQSRSISYSSISQNIQDLQKWQHTGILAEARRNVSESLKAMAARSNSTPAQPQQPESSKFYSEPSKMYSVASKFYSEPAMVYSEPSKMYGEAEKFYSEPAKIYGEPSKFYSEPSKVYSQPAKVYSEPAKTYWPPPSNEAGVSSQATTTSATSQATPSSSRKPAIVSRIAFGEAQNSATSSTTTTTKSTTTTSTTTTTTTKPFNTYHHHHHHQQQQRNFGQHNHQRHYPSANGGSSSLTSPPRRIIFNLDKLPYDLLNAPEPPQQQQEQQQQRTSINPCIDAAVSTLFSTSSLSAHTGDQQQQSNQNAKRLPNEDLVKCVAEISHPTTAPNEALSYFTTERAHNEDYYTPTPEQNYEIEEAVSVMTNGRAHGLQRDVMQFGNNGGSGGVVVMTATTSPATRHSFKPIRQRVRFGTNIKPADEGDDDASRSRDTTAQQQVTGSGRHGHLTQSYDGNTNAKINVAHSSNPSYKPQYNNNDNNNDRGRVHHNQNEDVNDAGVPPESYDDYEVDVVDETFDDNGEGRGAIFKSNHNYQTSVQSQHRDGSQADGQNENENEDDAKVAYVVEGRNYRKYRVEEKTDDGFIVGEYGVVDHNDGNLRGVRYTADSTINRSLIQKALLTFLKLK